MPNKKVVVECLVDYVFEKDKYKGRLQVHSFFTVDAEYTNYSAMGNETWTWAQSHWPDFIAEEGPTIIIDEVEIPSILRWCCVTGVKGLNNNDLPFADVKWEKKEPTRKYNAPASKHTKTPKTPNKFPAPVPPPTRKTEVTDFETYKADKIKKAMEEE